MATYKSVELLAGKPVPSPANGGVSQAVDYTINLATAVAVTDRLEFGYIPKGAKVISCFIKATDMDTNGTPTLAFNIGDDLLNTRFFSASTVGQAGTAALMSLTATNALYQFPSDTMLIAIPSTIAATFAAGSITLCVEYKM